MSNKRPLASDEALGLTGYTSRSDEPDVAETREPEESPKKASKKPLQLAIPVETYKAIDGSLHDTQEAAMLASYDCLIKQQIADADPYDDLDIVVRLMRKYPYVAQLIAEQNKLKLEMEMKEKSDG
jgi:ferredoxin-like protein FixX